MMDFSHSLLRLFAVLSLPTSVLSANTLSRWDETYVRYADDLGEVQDKQGPYLMADSDRTFLHIKRGTGEGPHPVYIFAHGNDGVALLNDREHDLIEAAGYALISWESITSIGKEEGDTQLCMNDHRRVMEWVVTNAANQSLDTSNIVMGGRSRGSVCSWPVAQGQDESYSISGIYMFNALPSETLFEGPDNVLTNITDESPPAFLHYGPWCPKPIQQNCSCLPLKQPGNRTDIHSPHHGQKVVDAYQEVGMRPWINLTDGTYLRPGSKNIFQYFKYFISTLPNATKCVAGMAATCGDYLAGSKQDCAQCVRQDVQQDGALIYDHLCDRSTIIEQCMAATGTATGQAQEVQYSTSLMKAFIFDDAPVAPAPVYTTGNPHPDLHGHSHPTPEGGDAITSDVASTTITFVFGLVSMMAF